MCVYAVLLTGHFFTISIPQRQCMHINPPRPWRRSIRIRESKRAVESDTKRGEDFDQRDEHACGAE